MRTVLRHSASTGSVWLVLLPLLVCDLGAKAWSGRGFPTKSCHQTSTCLHERLENEDSQRSKVTDTSDETYKYEKNDTDFDGSDSSLCLQQALSLQEQAKKLREEANQMRVQIEEDQVNKLEKRNAKIDSWIETLLVQYQVDENTQLLKTVEQVLDRLKEDRYSQEQINAIFNRICETGPRQSRSNCSPIMELLVDAVGEMDMVERMDNPNKRWSGKVERRLRKRLFAMDWNMDIEEEDDSDNPWMLK